MKFQITSKMDSNSVSKFVLVQFSIANSIHIFEVRTAQKVVLQQFFGMASTLDGKLLNFFDSADITHIHVFTFFMSTLGKIKPNKQPWSRASGPWLGDLKKSVCLFIRPFVHRSVHPSCLLNKGSLAFLSILNGSLRFLKVP